MDRVFDVAPPPEEDCLSQLPSQIWPSQKWPPDYMNRTANEQENFGKQLDGYPQLPERHHNQGDGFQYKDQQAHDDQLQQACQSQGQHRPVLQHKQPPQQQEPHNKSFPATEDQRISTGMLVPVSEIPSQYRSLFTQFPYFNIVQSTVFQDVFCSDRSVVVSAPTGSGKTVVMELALVRLLLSHQQHQDPDHPPSPARIVYMAPMKALVTERYLDWRQRLTPLGLSCAEVTGDTDHDDIYVIRNSQVVLTTPEKWDYLTRRWRDHASLMQAVSLLLIDEVHVLSDESRGPTLEAVVSRMKTIRATRPLDTTHNSPPLRFVAVSATIPNVEDVATWLSDDHGPAVSHKLEEHLRPVKLRRVVLGYNCNESWSEFRFDISLSYRLASVIATYSDNKPTLVFVSTRKGTQTAASVLSREARLVRDAGHRQLLTAVANGLRDNKLREVVMCGVGYHHAGVDMCDRRQVEELFFTSQLPVLISTSTLAMGVNLPAHLVVIKSTAQYLGGTYEEYSTAQLLQMTGRAGRPQFDTHATAVIMTKMQHKRKYESLVSGRSLIESHLHLHLVEHLNAEIVLGTVTDLAVAVEWLRSTFFYVRVQRNPRHYSLPLHLQRSQLEAKLQEMCTREVNALNQVGLITLSEVDVKPTPSGRLMARYCVSFTTMKTFIQLRGDESLRELIELVSECKEFWDVKVRVSEKRVLNEMNKSQLSSIRFPVKGRIKTRGDKINCLVQATLGSQTVVDPGLSQEIGKIMRTGQRITKCLAEYAATKQEYELQLNTTLLAKCFACRLWENSRFVTRQLEKIGPALSSTFVNSKITSFSALEATTPRDIELILNRQPPFGNRIRDQALRLPRYEMTLQQINQVSRERSELRVTVRLANLEQLRQGTTTPRHHSSRLILGDADNDVVFHLRVTDAALLVAGSVSRMVEVSRAQAGDELAVNFISETWGGLDVQSCYTPRYVMRPSAALSTTASLPGGSDSVMVGGVVPGKPRRACLHSCGDKRTCAHNCCKVGVSERSEGGSAVPAVVQEVRKRTSQLPATPLKKMKVVSLPHEKTPMTGGTVNLSKFQFTPSRPVLLSVPTTMKCPPPGITTASNIHQPNTLYCPSAQGNQHKLGNVPFRGYKFTSQSAQDCNQYHSNEAPDDKEFGTGSNDEDFPDMDVFVNETEKDNFPTCLAKADEEYEDCFSEPLGIEDFQQQPQQDLSAAPWYRFQTRQQQLKNSQGRQQSNIGCATNNTRSMPGISKQTSAVFSTASKPQSGFNGAVASMLGKDLYRSAVTRTSEGSFQPSGAQYSQNQAPSGVQSIQNPPELKVPGLRPSQPQMNVRQAKPQGTSGNQNQMPQRCQEIHGNQKHTPVRSQEIPLSEDQSPSGLQETQGMQHLMAIRPPHSKLNHNQTLIRPQRTQSGGNWMPSRYPGSQMSQTFTLPSETPTTLAQCQEQRPATQPYLDPRSRPLQSDGAHACRHQNQWPVSMPALQTHKTINRPLRPVNTQHQQPEMHMRPESFRTQSVQSQIFTAPQFGMTRKFDQSHLQTRFPAPQENNRLQLLPAGVPDNQNQELIIPAENGNINRYQTPVSMTEGHSYDYSRRGEPINDESRCNVMKPHTNSLQPVRVEKDVLSPFVSSLGSDSVESGQGAQINDDQYPKPMGGGNIMKQYIHPEQIRVTSQDRKVNLNSRPVPFNQRAIRPLQQNAGQKNYSSDIIQADDCSPPPSTSTSQACQSILSTLQHNIPVAGVKPLGLERGKSSGYNRGNKEDAFSHLTKEWTEAQRGKDRIRLTNISAPTPQRSRGCSDTRNTVKGDLQDDWRDLEIFQWCRQQERNTLDSLYQQDQNPSQQYLPQPYRNPNSLAPQPGPTNVLPSLPETGSLHITYGRGNRGPSVGVDVTSLGSLQQNININLSNMTSHHDEEGTHCSNAATDDQNGAEPQVRGILKKTSHSAWRVPDIFQGIL